MFHDGAELIEVLVGRVLNIDRNVNIRHAETADAPCLIWQSLLVCMEPEIDDVPDPQGLDVCELRFGRLTGSGDPAIKPTPVVDSFRVAHRSPISKSV